jgi:hypothetical protein
MRCTLAIFVSVSICLLWGSSVEAGHLPVDYHIPSIKQSPDIDGQLNEAVWQQAAQVELIYESRPGDNLPARVKTVAYFFENGENVYVAFVAEDPDVSQLRAFYNDRDQSWQDDQVSIMIDTFNDQRRAYQFFVNPLGIQSDSVIDQVNGKEDFSWNAIWDSAGQITEQGYVVEMAIPLRALRFNDSLSHQIWGIEFIRFWPRENRYRFSNLKREKGSPCGLCELHKMEGLSNVVEANNFEWVPTLTLARNDIRDDISSSNWQSDNRSELGADLRWGINQDMYLNATVNPDFSQVEADSAQLSVNTQFSLFFPEKRTFFLDGADYFQSPNRLVHTRNIADPDYGIKLTGKNGHHAYGVILANDTQTSFLLPTSQSSSVFQLEGQSSDILIARWRRDVGDKNTWGFLTTHREADGYHNSVVALDGQFWWSDNDYFQFQWMNSDSETPFDEDPERAHDQAFSLRYQHEDRNWQWQLSHVDYGKDFRADLGFINQVDFRKTAVGARRNWFFDGEQFLTHFNIYSDYDITFDQSNKKLEEEFEIWFNFEGAFQFEGWFGGGRRERYASRTFELEYLPSGIDPDAPDYQAQFHTFELDDYFYESFFGVGAGYRPNAHLKFSLRAKFGDSVDVYNIQLGTSHEIKSEIEWRPNRNMKVSLGHVRNWLDVDEGELFKAKLTELRLSYQFDRRHRLRTSVQYLDLVRDPTLYSEQYRVVTNPQDYLLALPDARYKDLAMQLVYSYKVNPQTLVYLGYSSFGYQSDATEQIETTNQSFFAKFSYAFQS